MPFPMRIQPIDAIRNDAVKPPLLKSRLKRLFDRPFNSVLRISSAEKQFAGTPPDFEPNSVCLDNMVQSFIEDSNEQKQTFGGGEKYSRHRCNCFNGNINDSSDDEFGFFSDSLTASSSISDPSDTLTSLVPCPSMAEINLLADTSKMVEDNNTTCKRKDDLRKIVTDSLIALEYNASICKSKWEKSYLIPAGEYEYIDVIIKGERIIIDVDFRSEFEIARSTSAYKSILRCLPSIFVGKQDRLLSILSIASEAARQSLKKKGMHIAPWRKAEYTKSKWLSPYSRITELKLSDEAPEPQVIECGELDLIFGKFDLEEPKSSVKIPGEATPPVTWQLPEVSPKSLERGNKITGLASLLIEKL